jgi:hypothetical protein
MKRLEITIENCGRVALALAAGVGAGLLGFLLWAVLEHGAQ